MPEQRSPETQRGELAEYADVVEVGFNDRGFILVFSQRIFGGDKPVSVSRVTVAPKTAGELTKILAGAVGEFEKKFNQQITPPGVSIQIEEGERQAAKA